MAEQNTTKSGAPKRRNGLKILGFGIGGLLVLLIVAYIVGTSSGFFKSVILPKVSASMNAQVTVDEASISPFSSVVLKNLKVQTTGAEALFTAAEVRARYSLMDIIGGHINIDEVGVVSPVVCLVQNADGSSNLDPITKSGSSGKSPSQPSEPASKKPLNLNLKKVTLTDGAVKVISLAKTGARTTVEINRLNFSLENIANNQSGKMAVKGELRMEQGGSNATSLLRAGMDGAFALALTQDLMPASVQGNARLDVAEATGALSGAAGLGVALNCDLNPTQLKQISLGLVKGNARLGDLLISGPFDAQKLEGNLTVTLQSIDKNLLNLAGAAQGLDFGPTTLNSTSQVQIAKSGQLITAAGGLSLAQFQVTRTNQTTPSLNLAARYDLTVDNLAKTAEIRTLALTGIQKGQRLLQGDLTSPMRVSWGNSSNALGDSAFKFELAGLDLADWRAFTGEAVPAGQIRANGTLLSQAGGNALTFDFGTQIERLTVVAGTNRLTDAGVSMSVKGKATNLKQINLTEYKLELSRLTQPLLSAGGAGTVDLDADTADLNLNGQAFLSALLQAFPAPGVSVSNGSATLKVHLAKKKNIQDITGNLALADFSGRAGSNIFKNFGASVDLNVTADPATVQIKKVSGGLTEAGKPGGTFALSGVYGLTNGATQLKASLTDFNQIGLHTFLEPVLNGKQVLSLALNGDATIAFDPKADSSVLANLALTNLVVKDPTGQIPAEPLQAGMRLDASIKNQITEIKQARLSLKPTDRAKNEITLQGKVDMSETQIDKGLTNSLIKGGLIVSAEALDFTQFYDLFMSGPTRATSPASGNTPAPTASTPPAKTSEKEPDPIQTPFRNFSMDLKIGRVYLHELELTNILTTLKLDSGKVLLKPCDLAINGAPVKATVDCDLGVSGFKYLVDFSAVQIPFAPLVNSFAPDRRGQIQGTLTAVGNVSGAGTSGASLQKNLNGKFDIGTTNLNLAIANLRSPLLRTTINVIAIIPELVKGGGSGAVGTITGALFGGAKSGQGGLTDEVTQSPIDVIQARGSMGAGLVKLDNALVQSPAFRAITHGTVTLQPILTNSTLEFPLQIALRRSIAEKINFVPAGTPTNANYVSLPEFVSIQGTLGNPKQQINKSALIGTALQQLGGNLPGVNQKTGNLLQGLGAALGGQTAGTNSIGSTNSGAGSLLQGLGGLIGTKTTTNSTSLTTNQSPVGGLLQGLESVLSHRPATNATATGSTNKSKNSPGTK